MKKLQIENTEAMHLVIKQEMERSDESRYDHRLHGLLLVVGGQGCNEVAQLFGEDTRTIQRWVKRFEEYGFDGLREGDRSGRPRSLNAVQYESLGRDLRRSPRDFGYARNLWNGKILGEHLKSYYGVTLGVRQCQRIFSQMGCC